MTQIDATMIARVQDTRLGVYPLGLGVQLDSFLRHFSLLGISAYCAADTDNRYRTR
jgi:hypothetical protein